MSTAGTYTGSHILVDSLAREGVTHLFGVPGESLIGLMDALMDRSDMHMVVTRHEEGAAFAAEAFAKASGQVGVCFLDRAVGAAHAAIAIHVAHQDSTPMVVLAGTNPVAFQYREAFQEMDIPAFLRPMTKWQAYVERVDKLAELVAQAFRIARSGRPGPVALTLAEDVFSAVAAVADGWQTQEVPLGRPDPQGLERAADLLVRARRPAIIAGGGVLRAGASAALGELAQDLGAPVYAAWRRFDVLPHAHPLFLGCLGMGVRPEQVPSLAAADVVLVLGCRLSEFTTLSYRLPAAGATLIQVDVNPEVIGAVRPATVGMVADAGLAVADLLDAVRRRGFPGTPAHDERLGRAEKEKAEYLRWGTPRPWADASPVDPEGVMHTLQTVLPDDTALVTDAGFFASWAVRYFRYRRPGTFFAPTAGAMGYALPAAIGVQLATPQRPVVVMAGDGGLLMTISELETAVRLKLPLVILVFNNFLYGGIKAHQMRQFPGRYTGVDLGNPDFAGLARCFGAFGARVEANADLASALQAALAQPGPAVIELITRPERLSAFAGE